MGSTAPARGQVLSLFRSFLRTAREFEDYNLREYVKRRAGDAFRHSRGLSEEAAAEAFADGKAQLEVAKRQALVYTLYAPKVKSIMEIRHA